METWIRTYESVWLFSLLLAELAVSCYTAWILTMEYFFDKEIEESKKQKRKINKKKVKVVIDKDGNARIAEAPEGLDISLEHEGKEN